MFRRQLGRLRKPDWSVLALFLTAGACALEEGSTPTSNTPPVVANDATQPGQTAPPDDPNAFPPSILSPVPGTEVKSASPTLTVSNASLAGATRTTYTFQVANDRGFSDMVTREQDVPEGDNGRTSWQVDKSLEEGRYFWRVYAKSGTTRLTSRIADFAVPALAVEPDAPILPTGPGTVIVSDPLTNFSSVGEVNGGAFTSGGWEVQDKRNYIRYRIPTLRSGYVEWDNRGLRPFNPSPDQYMLFGMWDPSRGGFRANPFRVNIQKLDQNHNSPYLRLRWIANGEQHDVGNGFLGWDSTRVYRWRIQWGPAGSANQVNVFLNGARVMSTVYGPSYGPQQHWVELGIAERAESIVGVRYSNVEIGSN
jgi:hypothetical protein